MHAKRKPFPLCLDIVAVTPEIVVAPVTEADLPEILRLNARTFGPGRFTRTAYRIREGLPDISPFCLLGRISGELVASIRFSEITIGGQPGALLLGPLIVEARYAGLGYGKRLIADGMEKARAAGLRIVVLVGDEPYYRRFGFKPAPPGRIQLPGPVDPARLLVAEIEPGAAERYSGMVEGVMPAA